MAVTYYNLEDWGHSVTVAPAQEPVTLSELKTQARITETAEDAYLTNLITAARAQVEHHLRRKLITQTVALTCDNFPPGNIRLPFPNVQSISSIAYRDSGGSNQTETGYTFRAGNDNLSDVLQEPDSGWPTVDGEPHAVVITHVVGYGDDPADVPYNLRLAILMLATHYSENREAVSPETLQPLPMHITSILYEHRWFYD